jgi:hypothetical protein
VNPDEEEGGEEMKSCLQRTDSGDVYDKKYIIPKANIIFGITVL